MHDPQYRESIAWQNVAYNQPPHTSFYVGYGMQPPPLAPVSNAKLVWYGDGISNQWDVTTTTNWFANWQVSGIWTSNTAAVFGQGDTVLFDLSGSSNVAINLVGTLSPGAVTVYSPKDYVFGGSGSLAGTTMVVKAGTGTLTIHTTNSYSGATIVDNGTLIVDGSLDQSPVTIRSRGALQIGGGGTSGALGANIVNNGVLIFNRSDAATNGATISGSGSLSQLGGGALTLTGNNTYGGGTAVSNGALLVNNAAGSGTGTGAVTVAGGGSMGGTGVIAGPVTVSGTLAPGPAGGGSVGTLTISNNLVINSSATLNYALGAGSDLTVVSSNLTLRGTLNVSDAGGFGAGTYGLFTYGRTLTFNGLTIGSAPAGLQLCRQHQHPGPGEPGGQLDPQRIPAVAGCQFWIDRQPGGGAGCRSAGQGDEQQQSIPGGAESDESRLGLADHRSGPAGQRCGHHLDHGRVRTNRVQASSGDATSGYTNDFTDISGPIVIPVSGDATTNFTDPGGATNNTSRDYRIRLVP